MIKKNVAGMCLLKCVAGVALLCAGWMAMPPPTVLAEAEVAHWYVSNAGEDVPGCGSSGRPCKTISYVLLRPALNAGDEINVVDAITDNFTLTKNVVITGAASASIDGNGARIITVTAGVNASISNLTLRNGGGTQDGGLIHNAGTLTINNTVLTQGVVTGANGGAIFNMGTLTLTNTQVTNNKAQWGGGIENQGLLFAASSTISNNQADEGGGAIDNFANGTMHLSRLVIMSNAALAGGGIYNESNLGSHVWLTDTAIVSNSAQNFSAGIFNKGQLSLLNTTLSNNHLNAGLGAAIDHQSGSLVMQYATVAGNTVANANGSSAVNFAGGTATIKNTVIANAGVDNCSGSATSAGYNLSSDSSCNIFNQSTDVSNTDARLGALQSSSQPYATYTNPPLAGSPLVNRIPAVSCNSANDQRGVARPQDGACDIGAHEAIPIDLNLTAQAAPAALPAGATLGVTLNVTNAGAAIASGVVVTSDLPAGVVLKDCAGVVSCVAVNGRLTVVLGTLNAGATAIATVRLMPQQSGNLALNFFVAGNEWDRDLTNNAVAVNFTVQKSADLSIRMSTMPTVAAHALFTMAVEVENKGELAADAPAFTLTLPANVSFVAAQGAGWNCTSSAGEVTCVTQSPLLARAVSLVTISLQSGDAPATLQLVGNATSITFDPDLSNNTMTQSVTVGSGSKVALPVVVR